MRMIHFVVSGVLPNGSAVGVESVFPESYPERVVDSIHTHVVDTFLGRYPGASEIEMIFYRREADPV